MDTIKDSKPSDRVEYLTTIGLITTLLAIILAWRTFVGQDNGVIRLLERLF